MVQIKPKARNYYTGTEEWERSRFYLYETFETREKDCEGKSKTAPVRKLIEDKDKKINDFVINDRYLICWDNNKIKYWCLEDDINFMSGHVINLQISKKEKMQKIVECRIGSDPNILLIVLNEINKD